MAGGLDRGVRALYSEAQVEHVGEGGEVPV